MLKLLKGNSKLRVLAIIMLLIFCLPGFVTAAGADQYSVEVDRLVKNGGFAVEKDGRIVYGRNLDQPFIPASIIKIATALGALEILGPDYRFVTRFYQNKDHDLYIQGFGDPFLVSEEIGLIMERLRQGGVGRINNIIIDDKAFEFIDQADGSGKSDNPYDAENSALAVNFNTVNIRVDSSGRVRSAEPQTPTLPLMAGFGIGLTPGTHRINISSLNIDPVQYAGELFRAFQNERKVPGRGSISRGRIPNGMEPIYVHRSSRDLESIVRDLMLFSNNFIANQLFLACGAQSAGWPATWDKARSVFKDFMLDRLGLDDRAVWIVEGSGLSRRNLITPRAMVKILEIFKPYAHLLEKGSGGPVKSGTLTGVYSLAGYFQRGSVLNGFVIILNQEENNRDRLLEILEKEIRGN